MIDAIHQAIKESETKRMEREILSAVDRRYYDMRHPNWRDELKEYLGLSQPARNLHHASNLQSPIPLHQIRILEALDASLLIFYIKLS